MIPEACCGTESYELRIRQAPWTNQLIGLHALTATRPMLWSAIWLQKRITPNAYLNPDPMAIPLGGCWRIQLSRLSELLANILQLVVNETAQDSMDAAVARYLTQLHYRASLIERDPNNWVRIQQVIIWGIGPVWMQHEWLPKIYTKEICDSLFMIGLLGTIASAVLTAEIHTMSKH